MKNTSSELMDRARISSIWFALQFNFSTENGGEQSFCYRHDKSLNEWTLLGNLSTARTRHASVLLNGDLWMTGGFKNKSALVSTELVKQDGTISVGTPLPSPRRDHCMVNLQDGRVMILGGYPYSYM